MNSAPPFILRAFRKVRIDRMRDEPANEFKSANETSQLFEILWRRHLEYSTHLGRINFYPPFADNKAEEHGGRYTENTFLWIHLKVVFSGSFEDSTKGFMVSFPCLEFDKDVVYINLHAVVYHIMERWPSWPFDMWLQHFEVRMA